MLGADGPTVAPSAAKAVETVDRLPVNAAVQPPAQTAVGPAPTAPTPPSAPTPPALEGGATTVTSLAGQIARKTTDGGSRFDVQLTPEGLGRVDVAVQIDAQGRVTAALAFERPELASLLKGRESDLHAALSAAGLVLAPDALSFTHRIEAASPAGQTATPTPNHTGDPGASAGSFTGQASTSLGNQGLGNQGQGAQGQGAQGQGEQPRPPPFAGAARSFQDAAVAADLTDRAAAYRQSLSARGLDIRI